MNYTIKKLLGLTLLVALLLNGLINFFAARSLKQETSDLVRSWPSNEIEVEERILILKRAHEAAKIRTAKFEELGIEISDQQDDSE